MPDLLSTHGHCGQLRHIRQPALEMSSLVVNSRYYSVLFCVVKTIASASDKLTRAKMLPVNLERCAAPQVTTLAGSAANAQETATY